MADPQPLVSVNVLMYNSSKYIVETLESVKNQTYKNIELIISDDNSSDNTVSICKKWAELNRTRFSDIKLLVSDRNTGQAGNYNRAFRAATGEWVKELDGDDLLLPSAIEDLVTFVTENTEAKYIFGDLIYFRNENDNKVLIPHRYDSSFFSLSPEEQLYKLIYEKNYTASPASFYNRQSMILLGFENDERIPMMEDWPKYIKLLQLGIRYYYMDKPIVEYRVGSGVSTQERKSLNYYKSICFFNMYYRYPIWCKDNPDEAVRRVVEEQADVYNQLLMTENKLRTIQRFPFYRLFKFVYKLIKK